MGILPGSTPTVMESTLLGDVDTMIDSKVPEIAFGVESFEPLEEESEMQMSEVERARAMQSVVEGGSLETFDEREASSSHVVIMESSADNETTAAPLASELVAGSPLEEFYYSSEGDSANAPTSKLSASRMAMESSAGHDDEKNPGGLIESAKRHIDFNMADSVAATDLFANGPHEFLWNVQDADATAELRELLAASTTETSKTETSRTETSRTESSTTSSTFSLTASSTTTVSTSETSKTTHSASSTSTVTTTPISMTSTSATSTSSTSATSTSTFSTSASFTSTVTSTFSSTTAAMATTTEAQRGTIEWAVATLPVFSCNFRYGMRKMRNGDRGRMCSAIPGILSRTLGIPANRIVCKGFVLLRLLADLLDLRRLESGEEYSGEEDVDVGRMLSGAIREDSSVEGYFDVEVDAQSELEASILTYEASVLNSTQVQTLLEEEGFTEIEIAGAQSIVTTRDSQPWTTRGYMELSLSAAYTDDQIGNYVMDLFAQALSGNITTAAGEVLSIDPSNVTVFKTANVSANSSSDIGVFFFINTWSAAEDLSVLGELSTPDYSEVLQQIWDNSGVPITIDFYRAIYDVFGKITIASAASDLENQVKLTNPSIYDVELMKRSIRDSAQVAYGLGVEEIGVSVLNIYPYSETENISNRIEVAYLYNPEAFESYCEIAIDQASAAGRARLELSLTYPDLVDQTILPVIESFYQDPTLSCSGSIAGGHDSYDVAAAAYTVLFILAAFLLILLLCCAFFVRRAMLGYWSSRGKVGKGAAVVDEETPMEESSMNEQAGPHGSIRTLPRSSIEITMPGTDAGVAAVTSPDAMRVELADVIDDEPEVERAAERAALKSGRTGFRETSMDEAGFEYADDEQVFAV